MYLYIHMCVRMFENYHLNFLIPERHCFHKAIFGFQSETEINLKRKSFARNISCRGGYTQGNRSNTKGRPILRR